MMSPRLKFLFAGAAMIVGCDDVREVQVLVTPGLEEGVLSTGDPPVARVEITAFALDGAIQLQATAAPGEGFDLGELPDTSIVTFELTGTTEDGEIVARGRSVAVDLGKLDTTAAPLPLFIQRLGTFARPPGGLLRSHVHASAGTLAEQFLILTGGDAAYGSDGPVDPSFADYYDLLTLQGFESGQKLPLSARSMVVRGTTLLLISDDEAMYVDLRSGVESTVEPTEQYAWSEVSGGATIDGSNGTSFVVGPTRADEPTNVIVVVDASGSATAVRLNQERARAAAAYVDRVGLVIVGGATTGPGVEVVREDLSVTALSFPSDPVTGGAAVVSPTVSELVIVLGGRDQSAPAATKVYDLRCPTDCLPTEIQLDLSPIASRGKAFVAGNEIVAVGDAEPDEDGLGETLAFLVDLAEGRVDPLPFRERRRGAVPVPAPNGTLVVMGGVTPAGQPARTVEVFFPGR